VVSQKEAVKATDRPWSAVDVVGVPLADISAKCTTDKATLTRRFLDYIAVNAPAQTQLLFCDYSDPDMAIVTSSKSVLLACGHKPEDVLQHSCRFLQGPCTAPESVAHIRKAVEARETIFVNLVNYTATGDAFDNAFVLCPLLGPCGEAKYFVSFHDPPPAVLKDLFGDVLGESAANEAVAELAANALKREKDAPKATKRPHASIDSEDSWEAARTRLRLANNEDY